MARSNAITDTMPFYVIYFTIVSILVVTTPVNSQNSEDLDEPICLLYFNKNFTGKEPLLAVRPTVKIFETNLLFHPNNPNAKGITIQSVNITKENCSVILCNEKHLLGDCTQFTKSNSDISEHERGSKVYQNVRSVDCHCSSLNPDDLVSRPLSSVVLPQVGKLKSVRETKETEGYPKISPPVSDPVSTSCATLFRDWHYQGQSLSLVFAGSVGKVDLGLNPRVRSLKVRDGCTVSLWKYENQDLDEFSTADNIDFRQANDTDYYEWACCYCDSCSESVCEKAKSASKSTGLPTPTQDFSQFVKYGKKIIGIGRNYRWTKVELAKVLSVPKEPLVFLKPSTSYITEGKLIKLPKSLGTIFYELELGVVISKEGKNIPETQALDHVAGYFLAVDMTAKEFIKRSGNQSLPWEIGKGYDSACPVGEFIPKSMIPDPNNVHMECSVNGKVTQSESTSKMIFNVKQLISYVSQYMTLEPYDTILTGTPDGFGPLKDGDRISGKLGNITSITFDAISVDSL